MSGIPSEAVTVTPEIDTTDKLLEELLFSDGAGIIVVWSGAEDGFDCETKVVGDVLEEVLLT